MTVLPLPPEYVHRVERYYAEVVKGSFAESKSDYWNEHTARVAITFGSDRVQLSGDSGFYVPHPASGSGKFRLATWVQGHYKRAVLGLDRLMRLSSPQHVSTLLTAELAYDCVIGGRAPFAGDEYAENPFRFDASRLTPLFRTAQELSERWFLNDRYLPDGHTYLAAYEHAMFTHFGEATPKRYLEIGAGNGNLAACFKQYSRCQVAVIDLPETLLFSSCYLKSIFPDASILLPNEVTRPLTPDDLDAHDFVFLVPSQARWLPARAFDLVVNTSSLQEMTLDQIAGYFTLVQAIGKTGGLWCNINRAEKFVSRQERPIRACEYPYDPRNQVLVNQVDPYLRLVQLDAHVLHIERICA